MEHGFKWNFIDKKGTFVCENAREVNQLYFPICNEAGMKASVTPCLNGDAKKNQNEFLYLPVSVEDLHNNRSGRNFWVYTKEHFLWWEILQDRERSIALKMKKNGIK